MVPASNGAVQAAWFVRPHCGKEAQLYDEVQQNRRAWEESQVVRNPTEGFLWEIGLLGESSPISTKLALGSNVTGGSQPQGAGLRPFLS